MGEAFKKDLRVSTIRPRGFRNASFFFSRVILQKLATGLGG